MRELALFRIVDRGWPAIATPQHGRSFGTRHFPKLGVVVAGEGVIRTPGGELAVRRGVTFGVPAGASADVEIEPLDRELELLLCGGGGIE